MAPINKSGEARWNYEGFSSHVHYGRELIYEINNIFFFAPLAGGMEGEGKSRERVEDEGECKGWGRAENVGGDMAKVEGPGERLIKLPTCRA